MSIEQVVCPECHGRGGYTRGPYPATKCNYCNGKGYIVQAAVSAAPVMAEATGWQQSFLDWVHETWSNCDATDVLAGTDVTIRQLRELAAMLVLTAGAAGQLGEKESGE